MLACELVRSLFIYDPATGILSRRTGARAGCVHKLNGYRYVSIKNRAYREHRVIWLFVTGEWPPSQIDHKNGDRSDNRWENLRLSTDSQNNANKSVSQRSKSGLKGVSPSRGKWMASITIGGRVKNLGRYLTKEEAYVAYSDAARAAFGEFARV